MSCMGCGFRLPLRLLDFLLVLLQQFLSFANNMGIIMHHHLIRQGVCIGWLHDGSVAISSFQKIGGKLIWTRFSLNSDVKTVAENWQNGQERDFYQVGLNKLILCLDKRLNRFYDYAEK
ncbi:hypothetical protein AVEN_238305-1 [Araneus ventricosus]|uniref:Uncharacterized protein n=1 Tax=Araneus ventricosus TaxID=182803 RepID=A0A4Y2TJH7_ARAVE|nr:hypothetical protein AVEN_238305-1 [Araneus ventricosus]